MQLFHSPLYPPLCLLWPWRSKDINPAIFSHVRGCISIPGSTTQPTSVRSHMKLAEVILWLASCSKTALESLIILTYVLNMYSFCAMRGIFIIDWPCVLKELRSNTSICWKLLGIFKVLVTNFWLELQVMAAKISPGIESISPCVIKVRVPPNRSGKVNIFLTIGDGRPLSNSLPFYYLEAWRMPQGER